MPDAQTLAVYAARVADYVALTDPAQPAAELTRFIALLAPGARVLDLGCGPGWDAAHLARAGMVVEAEDASAAMIAHAAQLPGVSARVASFDDLEAEARYDGIWSSFALLHAPRAALPRHMAAIRCALRPGGVVAISMKTGEGEARDNLGRAYTYVTGDEMTGLLTEAGLTVTALHVGRAIGLAGEIEPYFAVFARG